MVAASSSSATGDDGDISSHGAHHVTRGGISLNIAATITS